MSNRREAARRALADVECNVGFAAAVLEGLPGGELWADDDAAPHAFHAVHPCGMSLAWGPGLGEVADVAVHRIRERAARGRGEWLQVDPRWHGLDWDTMLGAVPLAEADGREAAVVRRTRLNFAFDAAAFAAARADVAGTVRRATETDFAWPGGTVPSDCWPDARTFLAQGGGWVAEVDGAPAALAFAAMTSGDDVEVGIETLPAFRRRGLARVACAALVEDLVAAGRTPVWSCREDNVGSERLAGTLGFAVSRRLPYWEVRAAAARRGSVPSRR